MNWLLIHGILFPLITALPLLIVLLVGLVAQREASTANRSPVFAPRQVAPLLTATVMSWTAITAWFVFDHEAIATGARGAWLGSVEIGAFLILSGLFALPLLRKIEQAALRSVQEQLTEGEFRFRSASLAPRKLSHYLPTTIQLVPALLCVLLLSRLIVRMVETDAHLRWFLPVGYGGAAVVFFLLCEAWLRSEAVGAQALPAPSASGPTPEAAEETRRQRVRLIFTVQSVLTLFFPAMALLAAEVRLQSPGGGAAAVALGAVGAVIGTMGCAFALSSDLQERYLRLIARKPS